MKDFFISRNGKDKAWAEWIASALVDAGYSVVIQDWDFRPGGNFVLDMDRAIKGTQKTIVVLSDNFLNAEFTQPEWAAAFRQDPQGIKRALIPVKVRDCKPLGLLSQISYINFVNLAGESECRTALLDGLKKPGPPNEKPQFPGTTQNQQHTSTRVPFPGDLWNVPYDRNNFFTGRKQILADLRQRLTEESTAALSQTQAISGLGGIGKTQTAVEYAYRYAQDYQAVFWVRAETRTDIITEFVEIAKRLELPQADAQEPMEAVNAVKRWLGRENDWLLVFDNADTPKLVREFRPQRFKGHILLTSREQHFDILGIAKPVLLSKMGTEEARVFLLRRTDKDESIDPAELAAINDLSRELDYLPLALEQAGAYILKQQVRILDYLTSFSRRRLKLLEKSTPITGDYPASVATTWSLNFEQVSAESEASADILRASAFFSPDAIPYELLRGGASELADTITKALSEDTGDPLLLNELLTTLTNYSLIRRDSISDTYSIHRLVQEVLKDEMEPDEYRTWAERVVRAIAQVFPNAEFKNWPQCDRLLPQAQVAARLVQDSDFKSEVSSRLLTKLGYYFQKQGRYHEAEPFYVQALNLDKKLFGQSHHLVITDLNNLSSLYNLLGRYKEAEPLLVQALQSSQELLVNKGHHVANSHHNLAQLYLLQKRYQQAEHHLIQAKKLYRELLGDKHHTFILICNNLATLYKSQGRFEKAEHLYLQVLKQYKEEPFGNKHPSVATSLSNLADLYLSLGRYKQAESLYLQALELGQELLRDQHPSISYSLNGLALLYQAQGRDEKAEPLYVRALKILAEELGSRHPTTVTVRNNFELFKRNRDKA